MPAARQVQANFGGGVNPMQPSHLIADNEVQSATNVDFALMNGALMPRRGSVNVNIPSSGNGLIKLFHNYNDPASFNNGAFYIADAAGATKRLQYVAPTDPTGAFTTIITGGITTPSIPPAMQAYKQYALIASGGQNFKDDGTNTTEWIKQIPGVPSVVVNTLAPLTTTGTWILINGTNFTISTDGTATFVTDTNNQSAALLAGSFNLNTNSGNTIGLFGVHFIKIAFDNPQAVTKVSWDYLLDTAGENYWHYELNPIAGGAVVGTDLGQNLINAIRTGSDGAAVTSDERLNVWSQIAQYNFNPLSFIPNVTNKMSQWAVPVSSFNFVGTLSSTAGTDLWQNIKGVRFSIEATDVVTATITNPSVVGAQNFPLTDLINGYTYWETWATLDTNSVKIDESAPSPPAGPFTMQASQTKVSNASSPSGAKHGITHRITYRQGGFMQDAYAISTITYVTATITDTMDDITALQNNAVMLRHILGTTGAANGFPSIVLAISEPLQDRVFISDANKLRWSLPGQPSAFPIDNVQTVSHIGDDINGLINWDPGIVIVNRSSVYEIQGTDFDHGLFTLSRTGCKHGSVAPKTIIRTPYGIPLVNLDGLTMYRAGYGIDEEIPWFKERYADIFNGSVGTWKGGRIPVTSINMNDCCATFHSNKLYIGMPTNGATTPNILFVLDFVRRQAWWHSYPYNFESLLSDPRQNVIWMGSVDGALIRAETDANVDAVSTSTVSTTPIVWKARTKQWTTPSDTVLEDLSVDSEGTGIQVKALYDNSGTPVITTLSNVTRAYSTPPLNGTFVNSVAFDYAGTNTTTMNAVYGMQFSLLSEPVRVNFWRTEYDEHNYEADKLWDVFYADLDGLGSSTITAVTFVDAAAVMTNTITSTTSGRLVTEVAFPAETYGRVAYTTYTASAGQQFKHWETYYDARNEPPKINYWRTDIVSLEENICDAWDVDISPNGTAFGTAFIDNVAVTTGTFTGTKRQSFTTTLPREQYGRTLYVAYTGTGFKHYQTWYHLRREPDRWTSFVSDKQSGEEHEWKVFIPEVAIFGSNAVLATAILDGVALQTYTLTASGTRQQYTLSLPTEKFGRTIWASYAVNGAGTFKHYSTFFQGDPEPPKVTLFRTGPYPFPSSNYLRTWSPKLDCRSGTVTGSLTVDDTLILMSTFTGSRRQWYTVGLDLVSTATPALAYTLQTGSRWEATYSGAAQFKHYETQMEANNKPFMKPMWSVSYRKSGGASQVDLARFWNIFAEVQDLAVATYWWDIDGTTIVNAVQTMTTTQWIDRIAFPPGARGYLFQFRVTCDEPLKVHTLNLDMGQEGIKALVRRGYPGQPATQNT